MEGVRFRYIDLGASGITSIIFCCTLVSKIIIFLGYKDFLVYHTIIEAITIVVILMVGIMTLSTHRTNKDNRMIFLGIAYSCIVGLDLLHMLTYRGIGLFSTDTLNSSFQLWTAARYMEGISFFIAFAMGQNRMHIKRILLGYSIIITLILIFIFRWRVFPDCYIEGFGFTPFRVMSEYIILGILLASFIHFIKRVSTKLNDIDRFMALSLMFITISQILFVRYIGIYRISNIIGHALRLVSAYFIYLALVQSSMRDPHIALLKKKRMINAILESSENGILIMDDDNKVIDFNSRFMDIMDISYDISPSKNLGDIIQLEGNKFHALDIFQDGIEELLEGKMDKVHYIRTKDDRIFKVSILPFIHRAMLPWKLISFTDITERRRMEELKRKAEIRQSLLEKVGEVNELKTDFIRTVSHEIKTPLNVILGAIQLLSTEDSEEENYQMFKDNAEIIKKNCFRLVKLADNLIGINQIDSGLMYLNLRNHNIVTITEDIVLSVTRCAEAKGIKLIFDTNIEERLIACDVDTIGRIMLNLLSNAVKFTGFGGRIQVNIQDKKDLVIISVKDNGIGIPKEMTKTIFDRFEQVDSSLRRSQEGSGIGLSIVKSLVEMHGGSISLNSEVNKGTEFVIELPVKLVSDRNASNRPKVDMGMEIDRVQIEFSDIYELDQN